eukprot:snap_masked-scaffold522_size146686-processed-gene-0.13 protein:Tk03527 transcript:snap_masked-scaffold522_size146686-processed-gene-0.13-mRNA-1 annotation:"dna-binding protein smubp-2-like isoform x1"
MKSMVSHYFNPNLDEAKLRAVDDCARCRNLTIIHGPPGTGKTTTLAAAVLSALANGDKVLVTAPSHAACDAITLAILAHWPVDILGQPDRGILVRQAQDLRLTVKSLSKYIVEKFILSDPEYRNQVQALAELRHDQIVRMGAQARGSSQLELEMTKSLSQLYQSLERNVLEAARVVVTTSFSVLKSHLFSMVVGRDLNLVCIDEAGFARDQLALHCIAGAARLILAGDHLQLPPIYLSPYAQRVGFNKSFLERLVELCPESVTLLTTQYRSHRLISEWSSNYFYQGQVEAAPSVRDQLLIHLTGVKESKLTTMPMVFIDTKGRQYYEEDGGNLLRDDEDESIFNYNEAFVVEELVSQLLALNVRPHDIGVITPYWAQVTLLRSLIWADESQSGIEIRTVDGYQGREKEVIIMSFVRSNKQNEIGFLRESRRTNVSITRARRACIAIGDSETLSHNHALKSLFTFCKDNEAVIPVATKEDKHLAWGMIINNSWPIPGGWCERNVLLLPHIMEKWVVFLLVLVFALTLKTLQSLCQYCLKREETRQDQRLESCVHQSEEEQYYVEVLNQGFNPNEDVLAQSHQQQCEVVLAASKEELSKPE